MHRWPVGADARDGVADEFLQVKLAHAHAPPADRVEVKPVDQLAQRRNAGCAVAIDVIKRLPRIESVPPADSDAVAEATQHLEEDSLRIEPYAADAQCLH